MKENAYLKFLHLAQAIQQLPSFPRLDTVEERLLNLCAGIWYQEMKITVTEVAKMLPGVSERTSHRRIKSLVNKGMVVLKSDKDDKRVKYILPTVLCEKYFSKMENILDLASSPPHQ